MNRFYSIVIALAIVGVSLSFVTFGPAAKKGLRIGEEITDKRFVPDTEKYALVNIWAAYNAESREENVRFSEVIKRFDACNDNKGASIKSVSVSMDVYESIFEEIVKKDCLSFSDIYRETRGFDSQLAKDFKLDNNQFGNFLIDAQGRLVAKNITPEMLEEMLNK